jgi:hypothetical protein
MFTNFGSVIITSGLWFGLKQNAVWGGFVGLFASYLTGMSVTYCLLKKRMTQQPGKWTWKSIIYELTFRNVMEMKKQLSTVVGYTSTLWAGAIRQLIPHLLLILFINLARADMSMASPCSDTMVDSSGTSIRNIVSLYKPLTSHAFVFIVVSWPFQVLGILCVAFAGFLFLIGLATPKACEAFDPTVRGPFKTTRLSPAIPDTETKEEADDKGLDKMENIDLSDEK